MKYTISVFLLFVIGFIAQGQVKEDKTTIVIAKNISKGGPCDKICFDTYKVIKTLQGSVETDTIVVGYYNYYLEDFLKAPKTALLVLIKYSDEEIIYSNTESYQGSYMFPEYNPNKGIQPVENAVYYKNCNPEY